MAITTYSELQSKIAGYLARNNLANEIRDAIALFEATYNSNPDLYFPRATATVTTVAGNALVNAPTDARELVTLGWTNKTFRIAPVTIDWMFANPANVQGAPDYWAQYPDDDLKIQFSPVPDGAYEFDVLYRQKLTSLSESNTTNWMLTKYPHVYVYGALMEMLEYVQDAERADRIGQRNAANIEMLKTLRRSDAQPANMVMQAKAGLP